MDTPTIREIFADLKIAFPRDNFGQQQSGSVVYKLAWFSNAEMFINLNICTL